jgi:hypothetical protein
MLYIDKESEYLLMREFRVAAFFLGNHFLSLGSIHGVFVQGDNLQEVGVMFVNNFRMLKSLKR